MVRATSDKPRLAVVLDYLWREQNKPLFSAVSYPEGKGVEYTEEKFREEVTLHADCHISCYGPGSFYTATLNRDVLKYLAGQSQSDVFRNPIDAIKLHAVLETGGQHLGCLVMRPRNVGILARETKVEFDIRDSDLAGFIEGYIEKGMGAKAVLYFLSVHFAAITAPVPTEYDTASPWCFPVRVIKLLNGLYGIKRGWFSVGLPGDEVPSFSKIGNINEYKTLE